MDSLKKSIIHSFCALPLVDELSDAKVVIVTHTGIITGTPVAEDEPDKAIHDLATISLECADDYRKGHCLDKSQTLDGSDGFLILKNVDFKSGNTTYHFNYLNIFYDQIVGVTLAEGI